MYVSAERRLLAHWEHKARVHGVPAASVVAWVRRKVGSSIVVWRYRSDGTLGCAVPCVLCKVQLLKFDFKVHCSLEDGQFYSGRLDNEASAPESKLTAGQRKQLGIPLEVHCRAQRDHAKHVPSCFTARNERRRDRKSKG